MAAKEYPTIKPTPLKGTLKKEDIVRAVQAAREAGLKAEANENGHGWREGGASSRKAD